MFTKAQDAYRKSKEVREARENRDLMGAIEFLTEYEFNEKVAKACEQELFMLPNFITIADAHLVNAVVRVLKDYGYSARVSLKGPVHQIAVSWTNPDKKEEDSLDY